MRSRILSLAEEANETLADFNFIGGGDTGFVLPNFEADCAVPLWPASSSTCGPHGTCTLLPQGAACVCDPGWTQVGDFKWTAGECDIYTAAISWLCWYTAVLCFVQIGAELFVLKRGVEQGVDPRSFRLSDVFYRRPGEIRVCVTERWALLNSLVCVVYFAARARDSTLIAGRSVGTTLLLCVQ